MIAFRSDASTKIGQGHTIRCLKLAKAIRNNGNDCFFICRDLEGNLIKKIQQEGFAVHVLSGSNLSKKIKTINKLKLSHADWLSVSWQQDAEETINAISSKKVDLLIVDHYALDKSWEEKLRPYTKKIMVIDDLADRKHDCDFFLDQNLGWTLLFLRIVWDR